MAAEPSDEQVLRDLALWDERCRVPCDKFSQATHYNEYGHLKHSDCPGYLPLSDGPALLLAVCEAPTHHYIKIDHEVIALTGKHIWTVTLTPEGVGIDDSDEVTAAATTLPMAAARALHAALKEARG